MNREKVYDEDEFDLFGKRLPNVNPVTTNPETSNPVTTNPVTSNPVTSNPVTLKSKYEPSNYEQSVANAARSIYGATRKETPTITHEFSGNQFIYDPSNFLCKSDDPDIGDESFKVYLCMYTINNLSPIYPVLLYGLSKSVDGTTYDFPQFTVPNSDGLISVCKSEIYKMISYIPTDNTTPEDIRRAVQYKGIVTTNTNDTEKCNLAGANTVYVFYPVFEESLLNSMYTGYSFCNYSLYCFFSK